MSKIYLISPPKIILNEFSLALKRALKTNLVPIFQLRLKDYEDKEIVKISRELKKICQDFNTTFILNDNYKLALEVAADGVHVGSQDDKISIITQQSSKNFIIGASCYDSRDLAVKAVEQGANYISFGTFFPSVTKNSQGKPAAKILEWSAQNINLPIVAIGGINDKNCIELVKAGADFVAVISYVWQHLQSENVALEKLDQALNANSG